MAILSTIRAYQGVLEKWSFKDPSSFPEQFAQDRFKKKFQVPQSSDRDLRSEAWASYLETDQNLPSTITLPSGEWYKARVLLHEALESYTDGSIEFPKGSSFFPTKGAHSIEARLSGGRWTVTADCFDDFAKKVHSHKALKRAFRRRYSRWFLGKKFKESFKESEQIIWNRFRNEKRPGFLCFLWKMRQVVEVVPGSRFSTVPKDNSKDRPINIEPLGNIIVQRGIGIGIRSCILRKFGVDLLNLQNIHKRRLVDNSVATIDLKGASDSISQALCDFMMPKRHRHLIERARSPMLLGHDGNFHIPKKISSMGNGFTFELMTLILLCITRVLDPAATVFGDDIIIQKEFALRLIQLLNEVGFQVNEDKSFIDGPFRESCGGNYHDDFGYIESFDFLYPETIADCSLLLTKANLLRGYPSFKLLADQLLSVTPKALRGGPSMVPLDIGWNDYILETRFPSELSCLPKPRERLRKAICDAYHVVDVRVAQEFVWVPDEVNPIRTELNMKHHWAKYEMYLHGGRRVKNSVTGKGRWAKRNVYYLDGLITRLPKSLIDELLG